MISKNTIRLIKSLSNRKDRSKEMLFVVEGDKSVAEVLKSSFELFHLYANDLFSSTLSQYSIESHKISIVNHQEIKKASLMQNPQNSIALIKLPKQLDLPVLLTSSLTLYLDGIQDPGNMGTILRICDWFGIESLFCSSDTADVFNPKTIQASMGSFCRVNVYYTEFIPFAKLTAKQSIPIYGAFMNESNIYSEDFPLKSVLVLGNEGNGIRKENEKYITRKVSVPMFSLNEKKPESLNVAVAAGIICSEIRRKEISASIQNEMKE